MTSLTATPDRPRLRRANRAAIARAAGQRSATALARFLGLVTVASLAPPSVRATPMRTLRVWTGAGGIDTNRSTPGNGTGGSPTNGDDLEYPNGVTNLSANNDIPNLTVRSISFTGSTASANVLLTGLSFSISNGISAAVTVTQLAQININNITLTAPQSFASTGTDTTLNFNGTINLNGFAPTFDATGNTSRNALRTISGAGGSLKAGAGSLTVGGNNTDTGPTSVSAGNITSATATGLRATGVGNGTTVAGGATVCDDANLTTDEPFTGVLGSGNGGGTFNGLGEGATFNVGSYQFTISHG